MKPKKLSAALTPSSQQRTLDLFFKRDPPAKRKNMEQDNSDKANPHGDGEVDNETHAVTPTKRSKGSEVEEPTTPVNGNREGDRAATALTPDQKQMIKDKQTSARLLRLSREFALLEPTSVGVTWFTEILENEFKKPYFKTLDSFYDSAVRRATVYPPRENIFSWTRHCNLRDVKVVIIGQDPYHGPNQAHGLCFSVQKGVTPPPSLVNMYKELLDDPAVPLFDKIPKHGHLVGWAHQGVLLLNAVLTVEASKANSHKEKGWENLTTSVIKWISSNLRNVVFLLWGAHAQKMGSVVDKSRHSVLTTVHPSPLSAHRGFFGCRHFSKCNDLLAKHGKDPINWEALP